MDELDRTDVEPARRLHGKEYPRLPADLPGQHDLLLIASRERGGGRLRSASSDVERWRSPFARATRRMGRASRSARSVACRSRAARDSPRGRSRGRAHAADDPPGCVRRRGRGSPSPRPRRTSVPATWTEPAAGVAVRTRLPRAPTPVPSTPARPTISPACTVRQAANRLDATVVACPDVLDLKHRGTGARSRLLDSEQHLAPHHEASEAGRSRRHGRRSRSSVRVGHGDAVRDLENLVQLVGDEDDRHPLAVEGTSGSRRARRFLRSEDRRGLVEDEDVGPAVERLQDLHALLLSDRDVFDLRSRDRSRTRI